jgi:hypothetical protein
MIFFAEVKLRAFFNFLRGYIPKSGRCTHKTLFGIGRRAKLYIKSPLVMLLVPIPSQDENQMRGERKRGTNKDYCH